MKLIVQQRQRRMYLRQNGQWTAIRSKAAEFNTVVEAIMFSIHCRARDIRLAGRNEAGVEIYIYPFGGDPVVKRELKMLRRSIKESHRLKAERRVIQGQIDSLMAEEKEKKKQIPFKRERIGEEETE
jgi:hypothetical protein